MNSHATGESMRKILDNIYLAESRRILAVLIRLLGDFDLVDAQGKLISEAIGAMSGNHCALYAIDETLITFLRPNLVDPANLKFWANFPKPGKYKVWFEYNYANSPQQSAFILDVK